MASALSADGRESAPPASVLAQNVAMSRFEARLALEGAIEARVPRLLAKKPSIAGQPIGAGRYPGRGHRTPPGGCPRAPCSPPHVILIRRLADLYAFHQSILRHGGYRRVRGVRV